MTATIVRHILLFLHDRLLHDSTGNVELRSGGRTRKGKI